MNSVTEKSFPFLSDLPDEEHLKWNRKSCSGLLETPIFNVCSVLKTDSKGTEFSFTELEAKNWVSIIPVFTGTDGKKYFVLERQFRHGKDGVSIEFPGGLIENNETPEQAARRELLEETGLVSENLKLVESLAPNPAFMNNRLFIFTAETLGNTGKFDWDDLENIDVFVMPESEVLASVGRGKMDNGVMLMCAYAYLRNRGIKL